VKHAYDQGEAQPSLRPIPRAMPKTSPTTNTLISAMDTMCKPLKAVININIHHLGHVLTKHPPRVYYT